MATVRTWKLRETVSKSKYRQARSRKCHSTVSRLWPPLVSNARKSLATQHGTVSDHKPTANSGAALTPVAPYCTPKLHYLHVQTFLTQTRSPLLGLPLSASGFALFDECHRTQMNKSDSRAMLLLTSHISPSLSSPSHIFPGISRAQGTLSRQRLLLRGAVLRPETCVPLMHLKLHYLFVLTTSDLTLAHLFQRSSIATALSRLPTIQALRNNLKPWNPNDKGQNSGNTC